MLNYVRMIRESAAAGLANKNDHVNLKCDLNPLFIAKVKHSFVMSYTFRSDVTWFPNVCWRTLFCTCDACSKQNLPTGANWVLLGRRQRGRRSIHQEKTTHAARSWPRLATKIVHPSLQCLHMCSIVWLWLSYGWHIRCHSLMGLKRNNSSIDFLHSHRNAFTTCISLQSSSCIPSRGVFERKKSQIALEMQCEELRGEAWGAFECFRL